MLTLEQKKIIISADSVREIVYQNMNIRATGGHKKPKLFIETKADEAMSQRNYAQRRKKRRETVKELITNNFCADKSSMITLTFEAPKSPEFQKILAARFQTVEADNLYSLDNLLIGDDDIYSHRVQTIPTEDLFVEDDEDEPEPVEVNTEDLFVEDDDKDEPIWRKPPEPARRPEEQFQDLKQCNTEFKKFIQRINYYYENFRYVAVMAKQRNGNWHYHMFCNLPFIDYTELLELWRNGGVYISKADKDSFEIQWKYMLKNMSEDKAPNLEGENGYLASRGLKRNMVYRSWQKDEVAQMNWVEGYVQKHAKPILEHISTSPEHEGECWYYRYDVAVPEIIKPQDIAKLREKKKDAK